MLPVSGILSFLSLVPEKWLREWECSALSRHNSRQYRIDGENSDSSSLLCCLAHHIVTSDTVLELEYSISILTLIFFHQTIFSTQNFFSAQNFFLIPNYLWHKNFLYPQFFHIDPKIFYPNFFRPQFFFYSNFFSTRNLSHIYFSTQHSLTLHQFISTIMC